MENVDYGIKWPSVKGSAKSLEIKNVTYLHVGPKII